MNFLKKSQHRHKPESLPRHPSALAEERVPRAGAAAAERGREEEARHGGQGCRQKEEGRLHIQKIRLTLVVEVHPIKVIFPSRQSMFSVIRLCDCNYGISRRLAERNRW